MEDLTQGTELREILGPCSANMFKYVKTNVPGPGCDLELFMEEFQGCTCNKTCSEESCPCFNVFGAAYYHGLLLENGFCSEKPSRPIIECGKNCSCQANECALRLVQKGIQAKLKVVKTAEKGYGLKTEDEIARLAFVCEYAGEVVSESEARKRLKACEQSGIMNYLIAIKESSSISKSQIFVDPREEGNIGRFINHSCDPNLIMVPVRINHYVPRLALFARKTISSGDELTFDYSGCTSLDDKPYKPFEKSHSIPQIHEISGQTTLSPDSYDKNMDHKVRDYSLQHQSRIRDGSSDAAVTTELLPMKRKNNNPDSELVIKSARPDDTGTRTLSLSTNDFLNSSVHVKDSNEANFLQTNRSGECDINFMHRVEEDRNLRSTDKSIIAATTSTRNLPPQSLNMHLNFNYVRRKKCLCKSKNCRGFLPYDSQLFDKAFT